MLAVGPGGLDKEGKRVTPSVVPGDKVLIPQVCSPVFEWIEDLHSDESNGRLICMVIVWREPCKGWR